MKLRNSLLLLALVLAALPSLASAQRRSPPAVRSDWSGNQLSRPFGLGVMIGEPTGLSAKFWLDEISAIDGGVAWSFEGDDSFHIHGDYLFHNFDLLAADGRPLQFYFGGGARLKFEEANTLFGIRIPVGLAYLFQEQPIDVNVELAPIVDLAPDTDLELNASVGARYYF